MGFLRCFYQGEDVPSVAFVEVCFFPGRCWILSDDFSVSAETMLCCTSWISGVTFLHPRDKSCSLVVQNLFYASWIRLAVVVTRIFASVFTPDNGVWLSSDVFGSVSG